MVNATVARELSLPMVYSWCQFHLWRARFHGRISSILRHPLCFFYIQLSMTSTNHRIKLLRSRISIVKPNFQLFKIWQKISYLCSQIVFKFGSYGFWRITAIIVLLSLKRLEDTFVCSHICWYKLHKLKGSDIIQKEHPFNITSSRPLI